jgi:hypothetical protein
MLETLSPIQLLITVISTLVIFFGLDLWRRLAELAPMLGNAGRRWSVISAIVLGVWIGGVLLATYVDPVRDAIVSAGLQPFLLAVAIVALAALGFAVEFRRLFDAMAMDALLSFSYWRAIFGVWLLAGFAVGRLPAGFGIPAGIGDIAVTLLAILLLAAKSPAGELRRGPLLVWNAFGLLDLLTVGFLAVTVLRPWAAARGLPGANFGLQLFVVPVFIALHLHIFARMWREARSAHRLAAASQ